MLPPPPPHSPRLRTAAWLVGLALVVIAVYAQAAGFGFAYDDYPTIQTNTHLGRPLSELMGVLLTGTRAAADIPDATRPTMVLSMALDHRMFGTWAGGYHLHSLLAYLCLCGVVCVALWRLLEVRAATFAGTAFFALAPVHAEVVASINYREDLLMALGVLGLLAWVLRPGGQRETPWSGLLIGLATLATVGAKESGVVLLVLVPTLTYLRGGRDLLKRREAAFFAMALAAIVWAVWRLTMVSAGAQIPTRTFASLGARLLHAARYEVLAIGHSLIPVLWSPEYTWPEEPSGVWVLALSAMLAGTVGLAVRPATRGMAVALLATALCTLPTSPLVAPVNSYADRYLCLSLFGGALFWGYALIAAGRVVHTPWLARGFVVAMVAWVPVSYGAASVWHDDLALWASAVERAPTSARAWQGLARAQRRAGHADAARISIDRALRLHPAYPPALVTRVYVLVAQDRIREARDALDLLSGESAASQPGVARARRCLRPEVANTQECMRE